jgi:hypothetical protein
MAFNKMTVDKLAFDKMTVDKMAFDKRTVDKMAFDKMTVDQLAQRHFLDLEPFVQNQNSQCSVIDRSPE